MRSIASWRGRSVSSTPLDAALVTNLSYVLHERSSSTQIAAYIQHIAAQRSRLSRFVDGLAQLSDDQLASRVVIEPRKLALLTELDKHNGPTPVVTLQLGGWRTLGRLLRAVAEVESQIFVFDRPSDSGPDRAGDSWFRAPSLVAPPPVEVMTELFLFAIAVIRPGTETILLDGHLIAPSTEGSGAVPSGGYRWPSQVLSLAESALRSHFEQWWCDAPLWSRPAEDTLPEFKAE